MEKASELLFEQYEYYYNIFNQLERVLNNELDYMNIVKFIVDGYEKKYECINLLSQKTYLTMPIQYVETMIIKLKETDELYETCEIPINIRNHVKSKFLYEIDLFAVNVIGAKLIEQSKIFEKEIEELNDLVDESKKLLELVKNHEIEKCIAVQEINKKLERIEKTNSNKLRSSYSCLLYTSDAADDCWSV